MLFQGLGFRKYKDLKMHLESLQEIIENLKNGLFKISSYLDQIEFWQPNELQANKDLHQQVEKTIEDLQNDVLITEFQNKSPPLLINDDFSLIKNKVNELTALWKEGAPKLYQLLNRSNELADKFASSGFKSFELFYYFFQNNYPTTSTLIINIEQLDSEILEILEIFQKNQLDQPISQINDSETLERKKSSILSIQDKIDEIKDNDLILVIKRLDLSEYQGFDFPELLDAVSYVEKLDGIQKSLIDDLKTLELRDLYLESGYENFDMFMFFQKHGYKTYDLFLGELEQIRDKVNVIISELEVFKS
jgi:hypothetical protein